MSVADNLDTSPADLEPPLYEVVDPDALDTIVEESSTPVTVSFEYQNLLIQAQSTGGVTIRELETES
jgi:hypothetical protein